MSTTAKLKAIRDAIKQQKWDDASQQAQDIVNSDPKSYQA